MASFFNFFYFVHVEEIQVILVSMGKKISVNKNIH